MKKERTEMDNAALPPLLQDEVKHDRRRMVGSSVSSGRDSILFSRITNFFSSNKELLLGLMLGFNIVLGVLLFYEYRHKAQQNELARANFSDWQTFNFNPVIVDLKAQVAADHAIIEAFSLNKTVVENCKRK